MRASRAGRSPRRRRFAVGTRVAVVVTGVVVPDLALAAVPQCPAPPSAAAELAPHSADFGVEFDLAQLATTPTGKGLHRMASLDLQLSEWLSLRQQCLGAATKVSVVGDARGNYVWQIEGPEVGAPERVACVADWRARRNRGQPPHPAQPVERAGGCAAAYLHHDGGTTITLGRDRLLFVSAGWAASVLDALANESGRNAAVDLAEARALRSRSTSDGAATPTDSAGIGHLAFGYGTLHREDTLIDPGPWRPSVRNFSGAVDIATDGSLQVGLVMQTRDFGESVVLAVQQALVDWSERAKALELPAGTLQGLQLETRGSDVLIRWRASTQLLRHMGEAMNRSGRGGSLF